MEMLTEGTQTCERGMLLKALEEKLCFWAWLDLDLISTGNST